MVKKYFDSQLNYTLGNEDTSFDVKLVDILKPKSIFSIAGCGSRALPLINQDLEKMTVMDFSRPQLLLTELRESTYRSLSYKDWLIFWGFAPYANYDYKFERKKIFETLDISEGVKDFFIPVFEHYDWESILYTGKWEKTFSFFSKIVRKILGKDFYKIFEFHSISKQSDYYYNNFPIKKWKAIIFILGNRNVFNALLYKGDFIKKNYSETHFDYYFSSFEQIFTKQLARESFFLNLCFFGKINHEDGNTIEAREDIFFKIKEKLNNGFIVNYEQGDMVEYLKNTHNTYDFLSLSDVPSYFSGDVEKNFIQEISNSVSPGGIVVLRNYLRCPEADFSGFEDISPRFSTEMGQESVQMYRIKTLKKI